MVLLWGEEKRFGLKGLLLDSSALLQSAFTQLQRGESV